MSEDKKIEENFSTFSLELNKSVEKGLNTFSEKEKEIFLDSYKRITSIQAWRTYILEHESETYDNTHFIHFFREAHNDLLLSHLFARVGSWRAAKNFLRSSLENVLSFIYYKDHPIELIRWLNGREWRPFSELVTYIKEHPSYIDLSEDQKLIVDIPAIGKLYGSLSQAVHASSFSARMTNLSDIFPQLINTQPAEYGKWSSLELDTVQSINRLLIVFYMEHLTGTSNRELREAIGNVMHSDGVKNSIKEKFQIRIV